MASEFFTDDQVFAVGIGVCQLDHQFRESWRDIDGMIQTTNTYLKVANDDC